MADSMVFGGRTVSKMTLGTVQLGMRYGIANTTGMPDEATGHAILQTALECGVTCLDTAEAYGESEAVIGRFLQAKSRSPQPHVVTKMRIETAEGLSAAELERQMYDRLARSLERLQMRRLPLVLLHNPDVLEVFPQAVPNVFRKMAAEGLIGAAGVSFGANTDEQFPRLWPLVQPDIFAAVQVPLNLLDHRLIVNGGLRLLAGSGKVVFARSVFLQGLLMTAPTDVPPRLAAARKWLDALHGLSEQAGMSVEQMAVSFVRDLAGVHSLVIGAETPEQVRANARLIAGAALDERMRNEIFRLFSEVPAAVINPELWNR